MSTSAITPNAATSSTTGSSSSSASSTSSTSNLTQADFLQLLTQEMENQDPLNPVSNDQFLAELAQFSNLQTTTDIDTTLNTMASSLGQASATSAYLGQSVTLTDSNNATVSGTVTQVSTSDGTEYVTVNGAQYPASSITAVSTASNASTSASS
jgi:flagellar basal-body rod modification protein FlgD